MIKQKWIKTQNPVQLKQHTEKQNEVRVRKKNNFPELFGEEEMWRCFSLESPPDWTWDKWEMDLNEACPVRVIAKICPFYMRCLCCHLFNPYSLSLCP